MFKRAWKCKKCPQCNTEEGCPGWTELMMTNTQSGEEKLDKGCIFQMLPMLLVEVIKASNRPASEIGSLKDGMINAVADLAKQTQLLYTDQQLIDKE